MPDFSNAYEGTSIGQYNEPDLPSEKTREGGLGSKATQVEAIGTTNVSSIYWAIKVLRTHGTNAWNFGFAPETGVQVFANSQVAVTMTELDNNGVPFLGIAPMQVYNVVPLNDGTVTVRYNVGWDQNLRVQFNFIIVN